MQFQDLLTRDIWVQLPDRWFNGATKLLSDEFVRSDGWAALLTRLSTNHSVQAAILARVFECDDVLGLCKFISQADSPFSREFSDDLTLLLRKALNDQLHVLATLKEAGFDGYPTTGCCGEAVRDLHAVFDQWMQRTLDFPLPQTTKAIQRVSNAAGYLHRAVTMDYLYGVSIKLGQAGFMNMGGFVQCDPRTLIQLLFPVPDFVDYWRWQRYVQEAYAYELSSEHEHVLTALAAEQVLAVLLTIAQDPVSEHILELDDSSLRRITFINSLESAVRVIDSI